MNCEFNYCIYNKNGSCLFESVKINLLGMCDQCIIVSIPDERLDRLKQQTMQEIEK